MWRSAGQLAHLQVRREIPRFGKCRESPLGLWKRMPLPCPLNRGPLLSHPFTTLSQWSVIFLLMTSPFRSIQLISDPSLRQSRSSRKDSDLREFVRVTGATYVPLSSLPPIALAYRKNTQTRSVSAHGRRSGTLISISASTSPSNPT